MATSAGRVLSWSMLATGALLLAGLSKAAHPGGVVRVLAFLAPGVFGNNLVTGLAVIALVGMETALGCWLLLSSGTRPALAATIAVLAGLTLVLIMLLARDDPPPCGCYGIPGHDGASAWLGVLRNGALILMAATLISSRPGTSLPARLPPPRRHAGAGFTMIEMLVVIVVLAVLLALALPLLASSRQAGKDAKRLSDMRQIGAAVVAYAKDYEDGFPYIGTPGDPTAPIKVDGVLVPAIYFRAHAMYWANLIWPHYLDAPRAFMERPEVQRHLSLNGVPPDTLILTEIMLTHAAAADAVYWTDDENDEPVSLEFHHYRGMKLSDVFFPSRKGMLMDGTGLSMLDDRDLAFWISADGSGRTTHARDFSWDNVVVRPYGSITYNVLATRAGLSGIDF